jgi:hypothetical protein
MNESSSNNYQSDAFEGANEEIEEANEEIVEVTKEAWE